MKHKFNLLSRMGMTNTPPCLRVNGSSKFLKSLAILFVLMLGVGNVWGQTTATLTFTKACGGSGVDDKKNTWVVTSDASESTYDDTKGIHYGTSKATVSYITLTTSGITGTITKIVVNASGASKTSAKLDVKVNNAAFGSQASLTSSAESYTFTGSASGAIEVKLSQSSEKKALYVKSIAVTYSSCTDPDPTTMDGECSINTEYSLTENCFTSYNTNTPVFTCTSANKASCTINGSTFTATAAGTYTIKATQEADATYCAVDESFDVVVSASCSKPLSISKNSTSLPDGCSFELSKTSGCGDGDGDEVVVTCSPASHYTVTGVSSTSGTLGTISDNKCTVSGIKADATISVTFTPDAKYTITWLVNGNPASGSPTTEVWAGEGVTALPTTPVKSDCNGQKEFIGWIKGELASTDTKPDGIFTTAAGAPEITEHTTFRAVFAKPTTNNVYTKRDVSYLQTGSKVVLVNEANQKAVSSVSSTANYLNGVAVTFESSQLTSVPGDNIIWNVTKNNDQYQFDQGVGKRLNVNASGLYANGTDASFKISTRSSAYELKDASIDYYIDYWGSEGFTKYSSSHNDNCLNFYILDVTYSAYSTTCEAALWSVTYNKNTSDNITGTLPATASYVNETQVDLAEGNVITRTGYTCIGWNTDKSATTALTGKITINNADVTLYAVWSANSYNVVFNKDDEAATGTMENQSIKYNESANLTANAFEYEHKSFAGWATESKGSVVYDNEASYTMNTEGANLYAVWAWNKTTVTLNKDGGTGGNSQVTATYGSAMPSAGNVPTKTGYTFNGYWTEQNGQGTQYYDKDNTSAKNWDLDDASKTLYAAWTPKTITITLNKVDDHGTKDGQATVVFGTTSPATFTAVEPSTGYEVEGYYTTAAGGSKVITADGKLGGQLNNWIDADGKWVKSSDGTLYAHYTPINYNVTWVANGTSWDDKGGSATAAYDAKIAAVPTTIPASSDCDSKKVFVGWTTTPIDNPTDDKPSVLFTTATDAPTITGDVTYYAVFAAEAGTPETWDEITAVPETGTYAILTATYFMKASISSSRFENGSATPVISNNQLTTAPTSDCIWEISKPDTYYRIKNGTNYAGGTDSKNQGALLTDASKDLAKWTISYSSGFTFENYGRSISKNDPNNKYLRNNSNSGWATYGSSTGSAPRLFKKNGGKTYSKYVTTCCQPLAAPTGIATTDATTATSITFGWNEVSNATGYQYKVGGGEWSSIQTTRTATVGDLTAGTTIAVKVRATYSGEGDYCAEGEESDAVSLTSLYSITASVNNEDFGTASVSLNGTDWSSSVAAAPETTIYVKAENKTGYGFSIWSVNDGGAGSFTDASLAATTFKTGAANTTIKATFLADEKVLDYITITSAPTKTEYLQGELFNTDGLVVTATYKDATSSPIALSDLTFEPSLETPLTPSNDKVVISYTFDAVTKSANQAITVTPVHTVQWLVNGSAHKTLSNVVDGTAYNDLEQPTTPDDDALASCDANKFLGWATAEIDGVDPAGTTVQWLQPATTTITTDRTFYAVYATRAVGDGTKTTAMADISTGATYYIGATDNDDNDYYLGAYTDSGNKSRGSTQDKAIAGLFKLEGSDASWAIKNANTEYYMILNGTNASTTNTTTKTNYTVSNETNAMKFVIEGRQLCLNNSAKSNFGSYSSTMTSTNYIWLEAYETITDYLTTCKDVKGIAVQTAPNKVEYTEEETLDLTGLVVRVTFDDDSYTDITTGFTTNPVNGAVLKDETEVVISYKEKQCTQAITITPLPRANIAATAPADGCSYTVQVGSEVAQTITSATNIEDVIVGRTITLNTTAGDDYVVHSTPFVVTDADEADVKVSKSGDNYTFTMPNKNVTITAQYVRAYTITAATGLIGGSVVADKAKASKNTKIIVTPAASAGYNIDEVYYTKDGEEGQPHYAITLTDEVYSFNMVESDVTVSTTFAPKPVETITLSAENIDADLNATAPTISVTGYAPDDLIESQKGVTWSIDNTEVAIIDATTGVITLKGTGTATITATSTSTSGITQTCGLNVYQWNDDNPKYTMSKEGATTGLSDINTFQTSDWGVNANYVRSDQPATKKAEAVDSWKAYIGATEISDGYTYQVADNGQTLSIKVGDVTVKSYPLSVGAEPKDVYVVNIFEVQGIEDFYTKSYTAPVIDNQTAGTEASCQDHNIFVGWVLEENRGNLTEDNIVAGGTDMTAGNHKYYAVWGKTMQTLKNKSVSIVPENFNKSSGSNPTTTAMDDHISISFAQNSATSQCFVNSDKKLRLYKPNNKDLYGCSFKVAVVNETTIWKITSLLTQGTLSKAYAYSIDGATKVDVTDGAAANPITIANQTATSIEFYNKSDGSFDVSSITVNYSGTVSEVKDYITECVTRYELSFNNNDGEGEAYETIKLANGIQTTLPDGDQLSKYLNTFTGWNTNAAGTGTHYDPSGTFTMGEANVELFAEWTPCAVTSIVLTTTDVQTTFGVNEKFNATNLKVKAIYGGCGVEVENVAGWTTNFDNVTFTDSHLGAQTVEVTFGSQTQTYGITVVPSNQISYYVNGVKVDQRSAFNNKVGEMPNAMTYWNYKGRYPVFAGWILTNEIGQNPTFITETTEINEDCNAYAVFAKGYTLGDVAAEPTTSTKFDDSKRYVIKATVSDNNKYYTGIASSGWGEVSDSKDDAMPITILGTTALVGVQQTDGMYFNVPTIKSGGESDHKFNLTDTKVAAFSVEADGTLKCITTNEYLSYSGSAMRWYSGTGTKANIYAVDVTYNNMVLTPAVEPKEITGDTELSSSEVDDKTNLVVKNGAKLTLTGDSYVINDLTIETSMADKNTLGEGTEAKSAQIINAGDKIIAQNVFIDITLDPSGVASAGWYAFAVPFPVDLKSGIYGKSASYYGDDAWHQLILEEDFAVMDYQGDVRAQGKYGWIKTAKHASTLQPGVFYLITVADTEYATLRFKKTSDGAINNGVTSMDLNEFAKSGEGADTDAGWNGIANPALTYNNAAQASSTEQAPKKAQVYYHGTNSFNAIELDGTSFVVGSPFFVQADGNNDKITLTIADEPGELRAPMREMASGEFNVRLGKNTDSYVDQLYLSATEDATSDYQIGHDMVKSFMNDAPKVAQMYISGYNFQLCDAEFLLNADNKAEFPLTFTAPQAGEYQLYINRAMTNATLYLYQNGSLVWNLSQGAYPIWLDKGANSEYSLVLEAGKTTPTDLMQNAECTMQGVQKFIYDERLIIIREGRIYNSAGAQVK